MMTFVKSRLLAGALAALLCAGPGVAGQPAKPDDLPAGAFARLGVRRGQTLADLRPTVKAAAYSPDGKVIATTEGYGGIVLWDANSGQKIGHVPVKKPDEYNVGPHLYGLSFSPDGKRIAWGGNHGVAVIGVSDLATGQRLWQVEGGNQVTFTPDGKHVIGSSYGQTPRIVDAATGEVVHMLAEKDWGGVWSAVSHDGKTVAVAAHRLGSYPRQDRVQLWDVATGKLRSHFDPPFDGYMGLRGIALSPDGKLVGYSEMSRLVLADAANGQILRTFRYPGDHGSDTLYPRWSVTQYPRDAQQMLLFGQRDAPRAAPPGFATYVAPNHLIDPATGKSLRRFEPGLFSSAAFSPDGKRMLGYAEAFPLSVWDVETGRMLPAYDGHRYTPSLLALDATGKTLVTADQWYSVCVWDVPGKKLKQRLDLGRVQNLDLAADGRSLLVTTGNFDVVLFDLTDYSSRTLLAQTFQAIRTPDGKHVACVCRFQATAAGCSRPAAPSSRLASRSTSNALSRSLRTTPRASGTCGGASKFTSGTSPRKPSPCLPTAR